ncbi:MAG: alpha/beta fold hydrolase, partial [Solirubrobacteraceae bacterium]
ALSPAGAWQSGEPSAAKRPRLLLATIRDTRRSRPLLPLLTLSPTFRRWALRNTALHGDRVSRSEFLGLADDTIGCQVGEDLLRSEDQLAPLDPSPCPITLAWSAQDRIFPVDVNGVRARELIPEARFIVLDGVGHVPMLDDPELVAKTILAVSATRVL